MLVKINKPQARKRFLNGETILMYACKMRVPNVWVQGCPMTIEDDEKLTVENFEKIVNSFEYYNCNNEMGKYTSFYIEDK